MLRRFLAALSLANLCFLQQWREALDPGPFHHCYYTKACPLGAGLVAVTINALLLTAVFFLGYEAARRSRRPLALWAARVAFLLALVIPLNAFRLQFPEMTAPRIVAFMGVPGFALAVAAVLVLAALLIRRVGLAGLARGAAVALLVLSPFVAIAYAQALWNVFRYRQVLSDLPTQPRPASPSPRRVLWLIFDELDYRVAFPARPASLELPEFDRLRAESLFAAEAYAPAGLTSQSMPAFVSGKLVADARAARPNVLFVRFHEEDEWVDWATRPTLFSRAREMGLSSAVVGWYHPYCRLFGSGLVGCSWRGAGFIAADVARRSTVSGNMLWGARRSFMSLPVLHRLLPRGEESPALHTNILPQPVMDVQERAARDYREMVDEALRIVADPGVNLAFVHLPIPHPPGFYDRKTGRYSPGERHSYLDSLALADRTLGDLRRAMEAAGLWETTAVLVTGDHWWRARESWAPQDGEPPTINWHPEDATVFPPVDEYRVPFILKLPGPGVEYGPAFNTTLGHDLVLSVLRGEVGTPEAAAGWLDRHRSVGPSPYYHVLVDRLREHKQRPWKN
jgi:hypothetical protein